MSPRGEDPATSGTSVPEGSASFSEGRRGAVTASLRCPEASGGPGRCWEGLLPWPQTSLQVAGWASRTGGCPGGLSWLGSRPALCPPPASPSSHPAQPCRSCRRFSVPVDFPLKVRAVSHILK